MSFAAKRELMSANHTVVDDAEASPSRCWCCGTVDDPTRLVRLGNHPEVGLCVRCAHSVSKWAWEIEDQAKTGPLAKARHWFRALRRYVIRRGWHKSSLLGGPIRWIGKRLP
jgi:hypothetical protein